MLQSLLPKAHLKFRALPLFGSVADGFDDWLATSGYTPGSRKCSIRFLVHADADLRKRGVRKLTELTRPILYDSWRDLIKDFPNEAGTVRTLARYLNAVGTITTGAIEESPSVSSATLLSGEYVSFLNKVRGCSPSTISHHRFGIALLSRSSGIMQCSARFRSSQRYRGVHHASGQAHVPRKPAARGCRRSRVASVSGNGWQGTYRTGSPDRHSPALPA